jgi:hypothetical protein
MFVFLLAVFSFCCRWLNISCFSICQLQEYFCVLTKFYNIQKNGTRFSIGQVQKKFNLKFKWKLYILINYVYLYDCVKVLRKKERAQIWLTGADNKASCIRQYRRQQQRRQRRSGTRGPAVTREGHQQRGEEGEAAADLATVLAIVEATSLGRKAPMEGQQSTTGGHRLPNQGAKAMATCGGGRGWNRGQRRGTGAAFRSCN